MNVQEDGFEACSWYRNQWTKDRNITRGAKGGCHDLEQLNEIILTHFPNIDCVLP